MVGTAWGVAMSRRCFVRTRRKPTLRTTLVVRRYARPWWSDVKHDPGGHRQVVGVATRVRVNLRNRNLGVRVRVAGKGSITLSLVVAIFCPTMLSSRHVTSVQGS